MKSIYNHNLQQRPQTDVASAATPNATSVPANSTRSLQAPLIEHTSEQLPGSGLKTVHKRSLDRARWTETERLKQKKRQDGGGNDKPEAQSSRPRELTSFESLHQSQLDLACMGGQTAADDELRWNAALDLLQESFVATQELPEDENFIRGIREEFQGNGLEHDEQNLRILLNEGEPGETAEVGDEMQMVSHSPVARSANFTPKEAVNEPQRPRRHLRFSENQQIFNPPANNFPLSDSQIFFNKNHIACRLFTNSLRSLEESSIFMDSCLNRGNGSTPANAQKMFLMQQAIGIKALAVKTSQLVMPYFFANVQTNFFPIESHRERANVLDEILIPTLKFTAALVNVANVAAKISSSESRGVNIELLPNMNSNRKCVHRQMNRIINFMQSTRIQNPEFYAMVTNLHWVRNLSPVLAIPEVTEIATYATGAATR